MANSPCPIWGTPATIQHIFETGSDRVESPRAGGLYIVSGDVRDDCLVPRSRLDDQTKARLTTWLIEQHRFGVECPVVSYDVIEDIKHHRALRVDERADRLLEYLEGESSFVGDEISFDRDEISFMEMSAWSESVEPDEVEYLLQFLDRRGFIDLEPVGDSSGIAKVSVDGHVHLTKLREKAVVSSQAFVAMWFDDSMKEAYGNGIAPAIRDAGYEPMRIDGKDHNNKIDDEIIAEIRRSRFVVADFTQGASGARGGVYYEAGFAHGLNIPVIFTCRAEAMKDVHFDTRQYNHIAWNDTDELRSLLAKRISATLGDGPGKKG